MVVWRVGKLVALWEARWDEWDDLMVAQWAAKWADLKAALMVDQKAAC